MIDHALVADWPGLIAETAPLGRILARWGEQALLRPSTRHRVRARGSALDNQADWRFAVQLVENGKDAPDIAIVAAAADKHALAHHAAPALRREIFTITAFPPNPSIAAISEQIRLRLRSCRSRTSSRT